MSCQGNSICYRQNVISNHGSFSGEPFADINKPATEVVELSSSQKGSINTIPAAMVYSALLAAFVQAAVVVETGVYVSYTASRNQ